MSIKEMVDNAIEYIDSLTIDELEAEFRSHDLEVVRKPEQEIIDEQD
jgi:hypothetical protein